MTSAQGRRFECRPVHPSGRRVEQAFQRTRLGSSERYQLLLGERASEDHGKVIERRRGTSARKRALSQLANDVVLERELSPVQVEFDDHPQGPRQRL